MFTEVISLDIVSISSEPTCVVLVLRKNIGLLIRNKYTKPLAFSSLDIQYNYRVYCLSMKSTPSISSYPRHSELRVSAFECRLHVDLGRHRASIVEMPPDHTRQSCVESN